MGSPLSSTTFAVAASSIITIVITIEPIAVLVHLVVLLPPHSELLWVLLLRIDPRHDGQFILVQRRRDQDVLQTIVPTIGHGIATAATSGEG